MKNCFYLFALFLSLSSSVIYAQEKSASQQEEKTPLAKDVESSEVKKAQKIESATSGVPGQLKDGQAQKINERIKKAKEKLERERIEGELPGDYIAAQEEKIIKMERKLEAMLGVPEKKAKASLEANKNIKKNAKKGKESSREKGEG